MEINFFRVSSGVGRVRFVFSKILVDSDGFFYLTLMDRYTRLVSVVLICCCLVVCELYFGRCS